MVSAAIVIGLIGLGLTAFLKFGGVQVTKTAFEKIKTLSSDAFDALGLKEDSNKSTGQDRDVENL